VNGTKRIAEVEPAPWSALSPWLLVAAALIVLLYLVGFDQGLVSRAGNFLHEAMHDGRHVLGLPCH
jgi:hypothetical protein